MNHTTSISPESDPEDQGRPLGRHKFGMSMGAWATGAQPARHEALALLSLAGDWLYAVRIGDYIKIGFTKHLHQRMQHMTNHGRRIGISGEMQILALVAGTCGDEKAVHERLATHCTKGREWYAPHPEVLAVVNEWREGMGAQPLAA